MASPRFARYGTGQANGTDRIWVDNIEFRPLPEPARLGVMLLGGLAELYE